MAPDDARSDAVGQRGEDEQRKEATEETESGRQSLINSNGNAVEVLAEDGRETKKTPQYIATIVVDLLHLIYGLGIGWSAIALPSLTQSPDDGVTPPAITLEQGSWLTAVLYVSAVPSMPVYGYLCERFGRKTCGYLIGVPYLLSAVMLALAYENFIVIQTSRALLGLAAGGIFVFAPLYVSEIVEDDVRGRLGAFVVLLRSIGILLAYVMGACFSYKRFEEVAIAFPIAFLVFFYWMPESPVHLLRQGRDEEALEALRWLRGGKSAPAARVEDELQRQKAALTAMRSEGARAATLRDLLATKGSRKAVMIGLLMSCDQQITGFYGIVSYTFMFFDEAAPELRDLSNVIVGSMLVVSLFICVPLYDKIARRTLLLASNAIMMTALLALSAYYYSKDHGGDVSHLKWLPVTAMSVYVVGNSVGLAALPVVILTEIFSPKVRNLGLTTNGVFTWFIIFLVTKTFPMLTEEVGFSGACWFYTGWCVLGIAVIVFLLPETKNRPLESILEELEHGKKKKRAKDVSEQLAVFKPHPDIEKGDE